MPLVHCKNTRHAAFFSVQSRAEGEGLRHRRGDGERADFGPAAVHLRVSRFAHYLKAMMRDKIGGYMSRARCETFLNSWIANYVVANDDAALAMKAKRPLTEARIDVVEVPGKPGAYRRSRSCARTSSSTS